MTTTMKQMVAEARERIAVVSPRESHAAGERAVILDVREPGELESDGRVPGALHVPRGLLESKADVESGSSLDALTAARGQKQVQVLCASGARAALAAETLARLGYDGAVIDGGLKGWKEAGLPTE